MAGGAGGERQRRAYAAASRLARDRMAIEEPLAAEALAAIEGSDIVVVPGTYDHVEQVLDALDLPYVVVHPGQLGAAGLHPGQLLVVNCPGQLPRADLSHVGEFVAAGGTLFSTDWALRHVIEPVFPGVLAYNQRPTADAVVRVEVLDADSPYLAGVMDDNDDPQWWLEASSYPITVLDPKRVRVLLRSRELAERWGEEAVAVTFDHGQGEVFHMISHYYLQRTDLRSRRHLAAASDYWAEKGVVMDADTAAVADDLMLGEVESGYSSARLFANVASEKKRRQRS